MRIEVCYYAISEYNCLTTVDWIKISVHTSLKGMFQHKYVLNEGIMMCLKINKYYTNVCQHNLFIL